MFLCRFCKLCYIVIVFSFSKNSTWQMIFYSMLFNWTRLIECTQELHLQTDHLQRTVSSASAVVLSGKCFSDPPRKLAGFSDILSRNSTKCWYFMFMSKMCVSLSINLHYGVVISFSSKPSALAPSRNSSHLQSANTDLNRQLGVRRILSRK